MFETMMIMQAPKFLNVMLFLIFFLLIIHVTYIYRYFISKSMMNVELLCRKVINKPLLLLLLLLINKICANLVSTLIAYFYLTLVCTFNISKEDFYIILCVYLQSFIIHINFIAQGPYGYQHCS